MEARAEHELHRTHCSVWWSGEALDLNPDQLGLAILEAMASLRLLPDGHYAFLFRDAADSRLVAGTDPVGNGRLFFRESISGAVVSTELKKIVGGISQLAEKFNPAWLNAYFRGDKRAWLLSPILGIQVSRAGNTYIYAEKSWQECPTIDYRQQFEVYYRGPRTSLSEMAERRRTKLIGSADSLAQRYSQIDILFSGGLDGILVASAFKQRDGLRFLHFEAPYDQLGTRRDLEFAEQHFGITVQRFSATAQEMNHSLEQMIFPEPLHHDATNAIQFIYPATKVAASPHRIVLMGGSGDETFFHRAKYLVPLLLDTLKDGTEYRSIREEFGRLDWPAQLQNETCKAVLTKLALGALETFGLGELSGEEWSIREVATYLFRHGANYSDYFCESHNSILGISEERYGSTLYGFPILSLLLRTEWLGEALSLPFEEQVRAAVQGSLGLESANIMGKHHYKKRHTEGAIAPVSNLAPDLSAGVSLLFEFGLPSAHHFAQVVERDISRNQFSTDSLKLYSFIKWKRRLIAASETNPAM